MNEQQPTIQELISRIDEHFVHKEVVASQVLRNIRDELRKDNETKAIAIAELREQQASHDEAIEEWNNAKDSLKELLEQWNNAKGFGKVRGIDSASASSSNIYSAWSSTYSFTVNTSTSTTSVFPEIIFFN